ncbi:MAG: hypothetical protein WCB21_10940 [Azonexus sp.]
MPLKEKRMSRFLFCIRRSLAMMAGCLAVLAGNGIAQTPEKLPLTSDYLGEIRRGADGKLMALPESALADEKPAGGEVRKATMVVGPSEMVSTVTEAARLARDGDVIEIRSGNYRGQTAIWTQNNLLIRGTGKRPVMIADGQSAEDKATWVVRGGNVRIENIEFRGARASDGNGAGIRFERGRLSVHLCRFVDNEMGILTGNSAEQTLEITDSEFGDEPRHTDGFSHLLYVGAIGKLLLRGSHFFNGYRGHLVKSRARESHVLYNMLADGKSGKASYELEFPNGGIAYVIGNVIAQSAGTDNPSVVSYGAEGPRWPVNGLYLAHNTLVNDNYTGTFLAVRAERFPGGIDVWAINNLTVGNGDVNRPAQGRFEGNRSAGRGELIEYGGLPLRLTNTSPLRGSVRPPGSSGAVDLLPSAEFTYPVGTRKVRVSSSLSPGAFQ